MFERLKNGWLLFENSLHLMVRHKKLLLFPAATAVLTVVIGLFFLTPVVLQPTGYSYNQTEHWKTVGSRLFVEQPATGRAKLRGEKTQLSLSNQGIAFAAMFYLLSMFLATFFNVAFYHAIFNALEDKPVSISEGLQFALTKVKVILIWSLFAGLVGLAIKSLEERVGLVGKLIVRLIGTAWSVASVFVIPVIVMEEHGLHPVDILRQSAGVIRKTWGEALAGFAGMQFGGLLVVMGSVVLLGGGFALSVTQQSMWILGGAAGAWVVGLFVYSYIMGIAGGIYCCVLYTYAVNGSIPHDYTKEMLDLGWKYKKA